VKTRGLPNAYEGAIHAPKESLYVQKESNISNKITPTVFYRRVVRSDFWMTGKPVVIATWTGWGSRIIEVCQKF
jgi:hypothetical protein